MFSVVIPAHNEAHVITRCLASLTQGEHARQLEIIVVCNGCTDDTSARASRFSEVKVLNIAEASKIAALNAGDRAAHHFPIAYLDADILISAEDLVGTIEALRQHPDALVAAPQLCVDHTQASFAVKSFYEVWTSLPYFTEGQMVGSGLFILSQQGRARFAYFPKVISDDGFVRSLFSGRERYTVKEYQFTIFAPKTLANLIKIKTRARFGNMEVKSKYPSSDIGRDNSVLDIGRWVLRRPWKFLSAIIYVYVQLQTKRLSRERMKAADFTTWERDESSRSFE